MEKESFKNLVEEVRDEFVVPAQMKQSWAADLSVLKEIDKICQQHQITYFADWGTLLGAVRHGGMIPWDDDLDIVMKRADYKRFLEVVEQDFSIDLKVLTYRNQSPDNWMFMGKVVKKDRICFEPEHLRQNFNYPYIASVDIFVLDYLYRDEKKEQERRELCLYLLGVANAIKDGSLRGDQIRNNLLYIQNRWHISLTYIDEPIEMARCLYGKLEELFAVVSEEEADNLCQLFPWGLKGTARVYPKEYYEYVIRLPFEDFLIPVPIAFDEMLRARYGEYWRIVKDAGAHEYPNFEMQKSDFEEAVGVRLPKYNIPWESIAQRAENILCKEKRDTNEDKIYFKSILREALGELVVPDSANQIVEMQQLAIEMGNLVENVKGKEEESISYIEDYCELLYELYQIMQQEMNHSAEADVGNASKEEQLRQRKETCYHNVQECLRQLNQSVTEKILDTTNVVIVTVYEREIDAVKALVEMLYQHAGIENKVFSIQVIVLNYYAKDYDGRLLEHWSDVEEFSDQCEVLRQEQMPIEQLLFLHPDIIISTNGYDQWNENVSVHPSYYSTNLRKCTDCLVYYDTLGGSDFSREDKKSLHNLQYRLWCPGVMEADYIVAPSNVLHDRFVEKLIEASLNGVNENDETLSEKRDLLTHYWERIVLSKEDCFEGKENSSNKEKAAHIHQNSLVTKANRYLLYCISVSSLVERGEKALEKIKQNFAVLQSNDRIEFFVITFPEITWKIESLCPKVIQSMHAIFEEYSIRFVHSSDINVSEMDAYYGDGSPYILKFQSLGKPIMIQNYEV